MGPRRAPVTEQKEGILQSNENPASLLWAHQLKREHGYLLVRLSKVETEHGTFDERIRTAERVTESVKTSVEELSRLVKDNEEADDARLEWATKSLDVQRRMLADIERIETSQAKTPQLEAKVYGLQNQLQQALSDHRSILQKLRALEAEMQARKGEMESLAHKNGLSDTRLLMLRLDALELNRKDIERRTEQMQSKIASLEEQCQAANARNTELESRLEALSTGSGHAGLSMGSPTQVLEASNSLYTQPLPDSHTEFPSQVTDTLNTALTQMTQSEIPTQVVDPSQSPHLELPASPAVNADQGDETYSREESPSFNAQMRKHIRQTNLSRPTARPSQQYAQILRSQLERQISTQTQDLDAPYLLPNIPNSGRKRKAGASYEAPKTRSQVRSQPPSREDIKSRRPSKVVILKVSSIGKRPATRQSPQPRSSRPTGASRVTKNARYRDARGRFLPKKTAKVSDASPANGKTATRRGLATRSGELQQLEQLKSFLKPKY